MIEFDPVKAAANLKKHGVSFSEAEPVIHDPWSLTREDDDSLDEVRFMSVGMGALGRILAVCWTPRGASIRLISARLATSHERKAYEG